MTSFIDRIWKECYVWILTEQLIEEYKNCLRDRGQEFHYDIWRFIQELGDKCKLITVDDDEIEDCLRKYSFLKHIDEDAPHILAAKKAKAKLAIFIDSDVEYRKDRIKQHFGVLVLNPMQYSAMDDFEFCTTTRIPFPF